MCPDAELCFSYDNLRSARVLGVDARARLVGRDVSLDLAATHLWTRDDTTDAPIEGRPTWRTSAALAWKAPGALEVDARVAWTDSRPYRSGETTRRSQALTQVDARLSRAFFSRRFTLSAGVENALDDNDRYMAVPPRTFTIGASGRY
jgi:outer membrane receptor for ferrienterochelin and colicin